MSDVEALDQNSCPACGAAANWNPSKQALICPYCGTEAPTELDADTGKVREIPLATTLRELPEDSRGWQEEKTSVRCQSCQAVMVFDATRVGQNCEFCGSPALMPYQEVKSPLTPQSLLPFKISEAQIRETIREWYGSKWFAPNALKKKGMVDTVNGIYLPYWTFDANVVCPWTADAGHYYYVTETYRDSSGKTQTRQVRRVRWEPASGSLEHFFDDEPVPGTRGVPHKLLRQVEPFPTQELIPYDKAYLAGFVVEHYQVVLIDAYRHARDSMEQQLHQMCGAQVPGDTYRNLRIHPTYSGETFKLALVPVWLFSYTYRSKTYQLLVNGYTGKKAGEYPKSGVKIALVVVLALIVVLIVVFLANR
jgi:hypothetical protein